MNECAGKLGPIRRINLTSQVMESIKRYILDNNLKPGDRLPTEKELVAELGVSRNILREALKSLEAVGLIHIRVGDGMYVSDFDFAGILHHITFAISRSEQEIKHFMNARLVIEVGALQYIIDQIQECDFDELEQVLNRFDEGATIEESAKLDLEFHQKLLAISRNPILTEFGTFLGRFFIGVLYFVSADRKVPTSNAHRDLLAALRARDLVRCSEIMRAHILTWDVDTNTAPRDLIGHIHPAG